MNDQTLNLIRACVERGLDNATIRDLLAVMTDTGIDAVSGQPYDGGVPRSTIVTKPAFVRPDTTRTVYRMNPRIFRGDRRAWAATLDRHTVNGNQRAVADYIVSQNGSADSRQIRSSVLTDRLHDDGTTNKAVESAIHALKTRKPPIIVRADKPAEPYTSDTGVDA